MPVNFDIKADFSIFNSSPSLAYFDSASTTLVPKVVIDATMRFLMDTVSSSRRGAHRLATTGSAQVETARSLIAQFLGSEISEISFQGSVPSAVASIMFGYPWKDMQKSKVVIAESEEHSIMVSMLRAAQILELDIDFLPVEQSGQLKLDKVDSIIDENTGIVAVGDTTVATGTKNPINNITKTAHEKGSLLITDMTRSLDFYDNPLHSLESDVILISANTGFMAPPGLIIQWIKPSIGLDFFPGILGGSSVASVHGKSFEISLQPDKFESGIINVPAIIGLGTSINYINKIGRRNLYNHIQNLMQNLISSLTEIENIHIYGSPTIDSSIMSFNLGSEDEMSCHDIALFLDQYDIAVRSGFLCAHPLVSKLASDGVVQISLHGYNSLDDCRRLVETLQTISKDFL